MLQDLLIGVYSLIIPTIASFYYETNTLLSALGTLGRTTRLFEDMMRSRPHTLFTIDISTAARDQAADANSRSDRSTSLGHMHPFNRARAPCSTATSQALQQARAILMWTWMARPRVNYTPPHDLQASGWKRRGLEAQGCIREARWRLERARTRLLVPR